MIIFSQKNEKEIVDNIKKHADLVAETVRTFIDAFNTYLDGQKDKSSELTKKVHKIEKEADYYRREADRKMFQGAFMPAIRESLFIALDSIDIVANEAETGGDILTLIEPSIPVELKEDFKKIGEITVACAEKLREGIYSLFDNITIVSEIIKEVERLEGEADIYIRRDLEMVFKKLDIKKFSERMMLREIILRLNSITNKMEDASETLDIIALKMIS